MCENLNLCGLHPDTRVFWEGFVTTVVQLMAAGWEFSEQKRFMKNNAGRLRRFGRYVILKNRKSGLVARITVEKDDEFDPEAPVYLDFMVNAKQLMRAQHKLYLRRQLAESGLDEKDIPALLNLITELQRAYPLVELPSADIVELEERFA